MRQLYLFILLCVLLQANVAAQDVLPKRVLRPLVEDQDTMEVRIKYDEAGNIQYLYQSYLSYLDGETYVHREEYRRNKYWTLWQYKEVLKRERRRVSVYEEVIHGKQYQYTGEGQVLFMDIYTFGEADPISLEWDYYPNGNLRYRAEIKEKRYWNFPTYRYPSGEPFDFGDFRNGQGNMIHLDDEGNPCLECQIIGRKIRSKLLCDEADGDH